MPTKAPRRGPRIKIATYAPTVAGQLWLGLSARRIREQIATGQLQLPPWLWLEVVEFCSERDNSDEAVNKWVQQLQGVINEVRKLQLPVEGDDLDTDGEADLLFYGCED